MTWLLAGVTLVLAAAPASAQESRAEALRAQRAEKARRLASYAPGLVEKVFGIFGARQSAGLPIGLYPYFGSVYAGGAVAVGAGYRRPFKDTGAFEAEAAVSPRLYWKLDARLRLPDLADGRVRIEGRAAYFDAPKINFYGLGNDSQEAARTTFRLIARVLSATALVRPTPWLGLGGGVDYISDDTGPGKIGPSIDEVFGAAQVPGLGVDPNYFTLRLFAQVDNRRVSGEFDGGAPHRPERPPARVRDLSPGYATRGGFARADASWYSAEADQPYSFRRFEGDAGYLVPILRDNWVIAVRGLVTLTGAADGQQVPYYLMPTLGYSGDLRGFENFRFRDRNRMLVTLEYRWTPSRLLDMVLFYDAGKVAPTAGGLDFSDLRRDLGVGARFHSRNATIVRLELAKSPEGFRFIFGVGPNF